MAGDIGIHERVIVLPPDGMRSIEGAGHSVEEARGRPMHVYGLRVMIAEVPPAGEDDVRGIVGISVGERASAIPSDVRADLDEDGTLGLQAFDLRQSKKYADAKASRPLAEENWDSGAALPPDAHEPGTEHGGGMEAFAPAGAPTSARLTGSVAVGLIIVEGPTADLKFSAAERLKVIAEVQNGLGWLGSYSTPAGVSWHYEIHVISLTVSPGAANLSLAQKEALWRDPAMAQLGFGPGMAGVQQYVDGLRTKKGTEWAYCAFFTKYPLGWFAYASLGGPRLVMAYENDGWGPDNIDRVFAHETGHIFGAPDEYASSGCGCGGQWGHYNMPNGNCSNCAANSVDCIMKSNSWAMCYYTPYHLGFPQEQRYSGVWKQGSGSYGLWVNASWSSFVNKWNQWSGQGLRLNDLEITRLGSSNRYSGVFEQGTGGYGLWVNASWANFVDRWKQWSAAGLRLIDLEITRNGDQTRYSGVFRQGSGAYGLWVNASWSSFVDRWTQWSAAGLRLVDFEILRIGSQSYYSGVFRQGSGAYGLWVNASWPSFVDRWTQWSRQGLRLDDFEIVRIGSQTRYSGVFNAGTGGYALWANANWASFLQQWKAWAAQGLRLIDLETLDASVLAAAPAMSADARAFADGTGAGAAEVGMEFAAPDDRGFGESFFEEAAAAEEGIGVGEGIFEGATTDDGYGFEVGVTDAGEAPDAGRGYHTLHGEVEPARQATGPSEHAHIEEHEGSGFAVGID